MTMEAGIGLLIFTLLSGFIPGLAEPNSGSATDSTPVSFEQLLREFCILKDTQHTFKSNLRGCYAVYSLIFATILVAIVLLIIIEICLYNGCCRRKSKGGKHELQIMGTDASEHTESEETQSEGDTSPSNKLSRFFKKLKKRKEQNKQGQAQIVYKRLPQEEKNAEENLAIGNVRVAVEFVDKPIAEGKEKRDDARLKQERTERARAELSQKLFKNTYRHFKHCPDLGSRLQKYWFLRGEKKQRWSALQFTAKQSKKCQFALEDQATVETLNHLFQDLRHPYLQQVYQLASTEDYVSIVQKFVPEGSLRDRMYKVEPTKDWSQKYTMDASIGTLDAKEVATCSRHILEALLVLYEVGFPAIGQVHAGNVFVEEGRYVLGGFENTLLGYRTSQYAEIKNEGLLEGIDIIMLGHLVYEVSSGVYLQEICPKDFTFEKVEDAHIQDFIRHIFNVDTKKSHKKAVKQILNHPFVKDVPAEQRPPLEITQQAKRLLEVIRHPESNEDIPGSISQPGLDILQLTERLATDYVDRKAIERIGWRTEKVWAIAQHGEVLLSAAVVPYTCPVYVQTSMKVIKEIFDTVKQHPNIHGILEMHYIKEGGRHITVSVELLKKSSLKDFLYKCNPLEKWDSKYNKIEQHFSAQQIARYGSQVLDALLFLYSLGFPPIGQVTTGNIFIDGDDCQLGALENVMLGHRTESYTSMKKFTGPTIDVFMFGIIILEMATGKVMSTLPTKQDYKHETKEVKEVLEYIFELKHSVTEVRNHNFFRNFRSDSQDQTSSLSLSKNARVLLQKVHRGKWRNQDDYGGKVKDKIKTHAFRKWGQQKY